MFCPKCGTQNPEGVAFCRKCGAPLTAPSATNTAQTPAGDAHSANSKAVGNGGQPPKKPGNKTPVIIAVVVILLIVALAFFFIFRGRGGTEDAQETPNPTETIGAEATQEPNATENGEVPVQSSQPTHTATTTAEPTPSPTPSPTQTPTQDFSDTSTLLKLLQDEYENGTVYGKSKDHTYYDDTHFEDAVIIDDTVYYRDKRNYHLMTYNISTKELNDCTWFDDAPFGRTVDFYLDGQFYRKSGNKISIYSVASGQVSTFELPQESTYGGADYIGNAVFYWGPGDDVASLLLMDMQTITTVTAPELEVKHGIMEPVKFEYYQVADGTVFADSRSGDSPVHLFKLDTQAGTWLDLGEMDDDFRNMFNNYANEGRRLNRLYGKYYLDQSEDGYEVFDITTGESVFESEGDIYPVYYFGGDSCITANKKTGERQLLNLKDGTLSEPLKFPEDTLSSGILNETYLIYQDKFGYFLWNMHTGEEETIALNN